MAPDGTTTADSIAAGGNVAQGVSITAGNAIAFSFYAKPSASNHLWLRLSDGVSSVEAWFDLLSGSAGTSTAGGGTCIFSAKLVEPHGSFWRRCTLTVASFVVTLLWRT